MKSFPSHLTPDNMKNLKTYKLNREIAYSRRYVYETMLSTTFTIPENCGINLQNIPMGDVMGSSFSLRDDILKQICKELEDAGFETTVAYGNTMLFVHFKGSKPSQVVNCIGF